MNVNMLTSDKDDYVFHLSLFAYKYQIINAKNNVQLIMTGMSLLSCDHIRIWQTNILTGANIQQQV